MIFMFRTRTWVPGRAVPWGLGRLPWAPGAPPRGSQGGFSAQCLRVTYRRASLGFASKIMSMLMSIFGRLGVHLGSLLGSCWGHVGAFFVPSWSRNHLRIDLSSKKRLLTKHCVFHWFLAQIDPKMGPRSTQDRSEMGPRSSWVAFFSS